mmetsp:Transcript_30657/g.80077  ORF Transcript_30657/g.80077 Transcript_30657/m.80077 type:complete len:157 (-) Transcript_30657:132-602(-)
MSRLAGTAAAVYYSPPFLLLLLFSLLFPLFFPPLFFLLLFSPLFYSLHSLPPPSSYRAFSFSHSLLLRCRHYLYPLPATDKFAPHLTPDADVNGWKRDPPAYYLHYSHLLPLLTLHTILTPNVTLRFTRFYYVADTTSTLYPLPTNSHLTSHLTQM